MADSLPVPGVALMLEGLEVPVEGFLLTDDLLAIREVAVALNGKVLEEPKVAQLPEAVGTLEELPLYQMRTQSAYALIHEVLCYFVKDRHVRLGVRSLG